MSCRLKNFNYLQRENEAHDVREQAPYFVQNEGGIEGNSSGVFMNFSESRRCSDDDNGENENFRSHKITLKFFRLNFVRLSHENSQ